MSRRTENIIQQKVSSFIRKYEAWGLPDTSYNCLNTRNTQGKENREHNTADTQGIRRERRTENIIQQKSVKENREHNTAKSVKFHKEIILSFRAQNCSLRSQLGRRGERGAEARRGERGAEARLSQRRGRTLS